MTQIKLLSFAVAVATLLLLSGCKAGKPAARNDATEESDAPAALVGGEAGAIIGRQMTAQKDRLQAALPDGTTVETANHGEALRLTFRTSVLFDANSSTLNEASRQTLRLLASHLNDHPGTLLRAFGHTDNTGLAELNRTLSLRRAKTVCDLLAANGVDPARMTFEGKGMHYPVADNSTEEGRARNRRIEIFILPGEEMILNARRNAGQ
ncbi:MAG: OmpA family protein [Tannerella sp.]|jgi:outer membrane protein OmpA-like peptidoglycan-associated protein|nr:OmpA family protein [Tannerella sp.]